jgi:hypothetical protein
MEKQLLVKQLTKHSMKTKNSIALIIMWCLIGTVKLQGQSMDSVSIDPELWATDTIGSGHYRYKIVNGNWPSLEKFIGTDTSELRSVLGKADFVCSNEADIPKAIQLLRPTGKVWIYLFENYLYAQNYLNFIKGQSCSLNNFRSSYIFFMIDEKGKVTHVFKYLNGG